MRRDIAPVHDIATFCTLQEPQITTDDPETTRGHALKTCCTRHVSAGMHSHCTACASTARSADVPACPATSAQRPKLSKSFSQAGHVDVQRVVDGEVDLRRTSTSELACDAGTSGTLSAGDLSWCCELAHLLFSWCAAESLRELQILRPLYLSCSATFEFSARK